MANKFEPKFKTDKARGNVLSVGSGISEGGKPKIDDSRFRDEQVLSKLQDFWNIATTYYSRDQKKMVLLDATDKGDIWRALGAKFPVYQILPDTNWVSYVKNNIMASIYTVAKSADVVPTRESDKDLCLDLSSLLNHFWDVSRVGFQQFLAGERASLLNLGVTQVGWSKEMPGFDMTKDNVKGNVFIRNIDPMKYRRDPFADTLDNAGWVCTYDRYHKSVFLANDLYRDKFKAFTFKAGMANTDLPKALDSPNTASSNDHYNLIIWWYRKPNGKIREVHTLDNKYILHEIDEILPNEYPFAELYCNTPGSGLIGVSEPAKIFADNMAYNMMQSIQLTAEYKNQRPPKFVSSQAGLNIAAFTKHGDDADRTFIVNGDATKAVHYHQFPFPSNTLPMAMQSLGYNIKDSSGVDGRYTGRDTGSIITTGGTQEMFNRVTLIDTPKIILYEEYACRLAKLILKNMICHSPKRTYYLRDIKGIESDPMTPAWITKEFDFPEIDDDILFNYSLQISSELPKNKQRVEMWANNMMEKQIQYREQGSTIDLITEEEWISYQDVPYKEQMLKRMGVQRAQDSLDIANQVVYEYAGALEQGMDPNQALVMASQGLDAKRQGAVTPFEQMMQQPAGGGMASGGMMPSQGL
jgi:hypothetical protein